MNNMLGSSKYNSLAQSQDYLDFRSKVPLRKICVDQLNYKVWEVYDAGPRDVKCPLVCLPPSGGTAEAFFLQIKYLAEKNIRVIAVFYPAYHKVVNWCEGFRKVLEELELDAPHILGVSLGGFLAQKFSEHTRRCPRVSSLILCHSYSDARDVTHWTNVLHRVLPIGALRGVISSLDNHGCLENNPDAVYNFSVDQLNTLDKDLLTSRLSLIMDQNYIQPNFVRVKVTLIDNFNGCSTREKAKNSLIKSYPEARLAYFKDKCTLPYLSDTDTFNLYLMVHLKEFQDGENSPFGAQEIS